MSALQSNVDMLREHLAKQEAQEALLEQQKLTLKETKQVVGSLAFKLKLRLEQQMKMAEEKEESSWKFNIGVLQETAMKKEAKVVNNNYSKSCRMLFFQDRDIAPFMKSCVNCFQRLDKSISHIENVITKMDERLTHIERFLTDDIKKEEFLKPKTSPWGGSFDF